MLKTILEKILNIIFTIIYPIEKWWVGDEEMRNEIERQMRDEKLRNYHGHSWSGMGK